MSSRVTLGQLEIQYNLILSELKEEVKNHNANTMGGPNPRYARIKQECLELFGGDFLEHFIKEVYTEIHTEVLKGFSSGQWVGDVPECLQWSTMSDEKRRELAEAKMAEEERRQVENLRKEELRASAKQKEEKRQSKERQTVRRGFRPCSACGHR
jgi:hypothetical protein